MKTSPEGRSLIEAFEGLFLKTYKDSVSVLTIGYGHTSEAGPPSVAVGQTISKQQADSILSADLAAVERNVERCIHIAMTQAEFDALVSFDFNTGALLRSSIDDNINSGRKAEAMQTLLQYNHAGGNVLAGLTRRRKAEKLMYEGKVQAALDLAGAHVAAEPMPSGEKPPEAAKPNPPSPPPPKPAQPAPAPQPASGGFFAAVRHLLIFSAKNQKEN